MPPKKLRTPPPLSTSPNFWGKPPPLQKGKPPPLQKGKGKGKGKEVQIAQEPRSLMFQLEENGVGPILRDLNLLADFGLIFEYFGIDTPHHNSSLVRTPFDSLCRAGCLPHWDSEFREKHFGYECGKGFGPYKDPYQQQEFLDLRKTCKTLFYILDLLQ